MVYIPKNNNNDEYNDNSVNNQRYKVSAVPWSALRFCPPVKDSCCTILYRFSGEYAKKNSAHANDLMWYCIVIANKCIRCTMLSSAILIII